MTFDPTEIEIRPLDAAALSQVLGMVEILDQAPQWSRDEYEKMLRAGSSPLRIALVACDRRSREVVGFAVASLVPPEAELESIAVAETARRRGIGRSLLASLVTRLRTLGIGELHLEVRPSNHPAIAFYLAANFKQTGVRPRYYADPEEDALLMTLRLA
jgi:[ribosomal protein S18]-alanine N-acetyltransferase